MKLIITKNLLLGMLLLIGSSNYLFANEKIEIIPEIKIEAQSSTSSTNPKLKQGDACADENLEEVDGEVFTDIPMAKTIPCDEVDCKDLKPAQVIKDNYVKLNDAKTVSCEK